MRDLKQGSDGKTERWKRGKHLNTCLGGEPDKHVYQSVNHCVCGAGSSRVRVRDLHSLVSREKKETQTRRSENSRRVSLELSGNFGHTHKTQTLHIQTSHRHTLKVGWKKIANVYKCNQYCSNHGKETARHRFHVLSSSPAHSPNGAALKVEKGIVNNETEKECV